MTEIAKKEPAQIIVVEHARLSWARLFKPERKRNAQGEEYGSPSFSCTLLLDPSRKDHAEKIAEIKTAAAKVVTAKWGEPANWPKANPATGLGGLIKCFGNGNDLPKVYEGFKDMFYVKCSDTTRPILGNRAGQMVVEGDPQCPYAGCYVRARISPWVYFPTPKKPQSANGVNMNLRSVQFMEDGPGFGGGGGVRSPDEEFAAMAGDAKPATVDVDPWG